MSEICYWGKVSDVGFVCLRATANQSPSENHRAPPRNILVIRRPCAVVIIGVH